MFLAYILPEVMPDIFIKMLKDSLYLEYLYDGLEKKMSIFIKPWNTSLQLGISRKSQKEKGKSGDVVKTTVDWKKCSL